MPISTYCRPWDSPSQFGTPVSVLVVVLHLLPLWVDGFHNAFGAPLTVAVHQGMAERTIVQSSAGGYEQVAGELPAFLVWHVRVRIVDRPVNVAESPDERLSVGVVGDRGALRVL